MRGKGRMLQRRWCALYLVPMPFLFIFSEVGGGEVSPFTTANLLGTFGGKITEADKRGNITLVYDFQGTQWRKDFLRLARYRSAEFHPGETGRPVWLKAHFDGDVSLDMKITARGGTCCVYVLVEPIAREGYVFIFGAKDTVHVGRSYTAVAKYQKGMGEKIIYRGMLGTWRPDTYSISLRRRRTNLFMELNGRVVIKATDRDKSYTSGMIGFAGDYVASYLKVNGRLNRRWFEEAIGGPPAADVPALNDFFQRVGLNPAYRIPGTLPPWEKTFQSESDHFVILSNESQEFTEKQAEFMEGVFKLYTGVLKVRKKPREKFRIVFFKGETDLQQFGAPSHCLGFYWPKDKTLYTCKHRKPETTRMVLLHEGFHQFIDRVAGTVPLWFNEGLAQYFETAEITKKRLKAGARGLRLSNLKWLLRQERDRYLEEFVQLTDEEFTKRGRRAENYSHAWGFCHFLLHWPSPTRPKYRIHLLRYFQLLCRNQDPQQAFTLAFAKLDWNEVQTRWRQHIASLGRPQEKD